MAGGASSTQGGGGGAGGYRTCTSDYTIDGSTYKVAVGDGWSWNGSSQISMQELQEACLILTHVMVGPTCKFTNRLVVAAQIQLEALAEVLGESGSPGAGNTPPTQSITTRKMLAEHAAGAGGGWWWSWRRWRKL